MPIYSGVKRTLCPSIADNCAKLLKCFRQSYRLRPNTIIKVIYITPVLTTTVSTEVMTIILVFRRSTVCQHFLSVTNASESRPIQALPPSLLLGNYRQVL